ncbi:MAG: NAD(P)-dependent glycerol-3-phosphate dehydrogenase [Phycisphaerales bacterium]|nr:NAD(P)-dependent glycerol-3-phosphate dehydrogenase [Phycisphaerales bacterium]
MPPPANPSPNPSSPRQPRKPSAATNGAESGDVFAPGFRVTILGIGQMGLLCAGILTRAAGGVDPRAGRARKSAPVPAPSPAPAAADVTLWGHSADEAGSLTQTRKSVRLKGFILPDAVHVTHDLVRAVKDADLVVSAVPVQFTREVWKRLAPPSRGGSPRLRPPGQTSVVSVAKGIEIASLMRPTQIIADAIKDDPDGRPRAIGVLSGPTIAPELARGLPATMIAAAETPAFATQIQRLFSTQYLRIYTHDDVLGVELAGAMKNVIAIAAGVLDGLQAGYNAKSALLARGLAEITRLGVAMGASSDTFFGLSGVGDLATTCFSPEGRNRSCGEALGRGKKLNDYLRSIPYVVEGVATTKAVMELAKKYKVEMPITEAVYGGLYEGLDPIEAIGRLMNREMKAERVG